jgi:hypothetical protein
VCWMMQKTKYWPPRSQQSYSYDFFVFEDAQIF